MTGISVVIPTWRRPESLTRALGEILACRPGPCEVLVHVDGGDEETERLVAPQFPNAVRWFHSRSTQGPGGGRNRLLAEATAPLVAGFDDDSWPLDPDYFAAAAEFFRSYPGVAVVTGQEIRPGMTPGPRETVVRHAACYQNGACVMRRDAFLSMRGHLPLRHAYGMEEADVALQLLDAGWELLYASDLRVYHDSRLQHHGSEAVNAAHICNTALLAYLRYPLRYWPLGMLQVLNRARYAAKMGRIRGIGKGLWQIPWAIWTYRGERRSVRPATVRRSRALSQ